jgi:hypothetical protein
MTHVRLGAILGDGNREDKCSDGQLGVENS